MQTNGSLMDRKVVHLQWVPEASRPAEALVSRRLDPGEQNALVARGNALVATGDLAGARLLYRRAAEAGNARAALTLAETYDPVVLENLGESGLAPNVTMARAWYKKANELGSTEALARLERLERRSE
jgi:TPR repeat protein